MTQNNVMVDDQLNDLFKIKIAYIPSDNWACGLFRMKDPCERLAALNSDVQFDLIPYGHFAGYTAAGVAAALRMYDGVVFQRVADEATVMVMHMLKGFGVKIYMDIDDNLFHVNRNSPAYSVWKPDGKPLAMFKIALGAVDHLFVSTPELVDAYKGYQPNISVFMNGIDTSDPKYDLSKSRRNELPEDKVIVMWSGSSTHLDSIHEIGKCIRPAFEQNPNAIFAMCSNPEFMQVFNVPEEQKLYVPHVSIDEYYTIPSMADIGLAPVVNNVFNAGKSELKCIEYGIWGVPTVCSFSAPYKRFKQLSDGGAVTCYENKSRDWPNAISKLIRDAELRKQMGEKARQAVIDKYDVKKINEQRLEFFRQAFN